MTWRLMACSGVVFLVASVLAPPDVVTQLTLGVGAVLLCAVPLWFLTRCGFVQSASPAVHTLLCVLVALVAVLTVHCYQLRMSVRSKNQNIEVLWNRLNASEAIVDVNTPVGLIMQR